MPAGDACRRCGAADWAVVLVRDAAGIACTIRCRACGATVQVRGDDRPAPTGREEAACP